MVLYCFFKPREGNSKLNCTPVRNADEAVELCVNAKPSFKCRGEYAEFTTEQRANVVRCAYMHSSPTEASHCL